MGETLLVELYGNEVIDSVHSPCRRLSGPRAGEGTSNELILGCCGETTQCGRIVEGDAKCTVGQIWEKVTSVRSEL